MRNDAESTFSLVQDMEQIINSLFSSRSFSVLIDDADAVRYLNQALGDVASSEQIVYGLDGPNCIALFAETPGLASSSPKGGDPVRDKLPSSKVLLSGIAAVAAVSLLGMFLKYKMKIEVAGIIKIEMIPPGSGSLRA